MRTITLYIVLILVSLAVSLHGMAQPGTTIEIKKPEKYEKRTLTSEKTGDKKFTYPKRVMQNAFTHYNYYFNANNILKDIVIEAKSTFADDYTKLLPFYNYSLDVTANSSELDSVIYKCNAGILLHDLRSDWVDNMYLLMGQAYFYRKNFDSADQVFRYINYAFAPKEAGGYDIPVGSNVGTTDGTFTVATKEKSNLKTKLFSTPPSRNDALLWQARNYMENGNMGEAAGILEILRNDPVFPSRLKSDLNETLAYWYYKQRMFDSAATHLTKALDAADSKQDQARMEFLAAQLYQAGGNNEEAVKWYNESASHTKNPIMEVYANLNSIKTYRDSSDKMLQEKLDNLFKMAHRDKYLGNKDIIYYAIAQVELERKDLTSAEQMLKKSIYYNTEENPDQRSQSFLLLADINYDQQKYIEAKNFYDSVSMSSINNEDDKNRVNLRQPGLTIIAENLAAIHVEDSLQAIAAMTKDQRDALIKKTVRQLRKQQGLKEDTEEININPAVQQQSAKDIFNTGTSGSDWYFNNLSLKSTGFNQFRQKWGNRPNTDNWRRLAAIKEEQENPAGGDPDENAVNAPTARGQTLPGKNVNPASTNVNEDGEITFETLLANIPLTEEQLKTSNDKIADALFANGQAFQDKLEDYPSAIASYESLLKKYPGNNNQEQALFNLYYCYTKVGRNFSADSARNAQSLRLSALIA
ncbi:MAG: tetratricopeptide repeat protein, partial [Panacibacter sp.]